jgi:hypothetical protein
MMFLPYCAIGCTAFTFFLTGWNLFEQVWSYRNPSQARMPHASEELLKIMTIVTVILIAASHLVLS